MEPSMKATEPQSDGDRLLLRKEVAVELGHSRDKAVRHLIYAGLYYMPGRWWRLKRTDLDQFLPTQLRPAYGCMLSMRYTRARGAMMG